MHRIWYTGGRWAYASALLDGFTDYIFITIDMADPTKPREAGRYWLPGMNVGGRRDAELADRPAATACTTPIIHDDIAYCRWRDACLAVLDVKDRAKPEADRPPNWAPPFGGGTHNCLPLPDRDLLVVVDEAVLDDQEDGFKPIWIFDNQVKSNPISISTFPAPAEADYKIKGGHFGPHNVHENRPGASSARETDLRDLPERRPARLRHPRPVPRRRRSAPSCRRRPKRWSTPARTAPIVIQSADVFVDKAGLLRHRLQRRPLHRRIRQLRDWIRPPASGLHCSPWFSSARATSFYKRAAMAGIGARHFIMLQAWFFCPLVTLYALARHQLVP